MNEQLLEQLLYEDESTSLDFKRDQYRFEGADDREKSELLKDVLAFANSWRRASAYILIGVEEVKGARSNPVGVEEHLEDASLQQFVHSKTNRPLDIQYRAIQIDGVSLGVIEIPVQDRPTYLKRDFGKLNKDTVYVRRGSSTGIADPTEVARMGAAAGSAEGSVDLTFGFADPETRESFGSRVELVSFDLHPRVDPAPFRVRRETGLYGSYVGLPVNEDYHEELVEYVAMVALLRTVGVTVTNVSSRTARTVDLRLTIPAAPGLQVVDQRNRPSRPSRSLIIGPADWAERFGRPRPVPVVQRHGDTFEVSVRWETILPGATAWSDGVFLVGAKQSQQVTVGATVYCEELPAPIQEELKIEITADRRPMDPQIVAYEDQRSD